MAERLRDAPVGDWLRTWAWLCEGVMSQVGETRLAILHGDLNSGEGLITHRMVVN